MRGIFIVLLAVNIIYGLKALIFNEAWISKDVHTDHVSEGYKDAAELRLLADPSFSSRDQAKGLAQINSNMLCTAVGPFGEMDQLREFERKWLTKKGVSIKIHEFQSPGIDEFVVKIDLENNTGDALYVIQRLQAIGLEGYLLIESTTKAVIVGGFNSKNQAALAEEQVQLLNLTTEVEKKEFLRKQFWIKVGKALTFNELSRLLEKERHNLDGIILSQSLCE